MYIVFDIILGHTSKKANCEIVMAHLLLIHLFPFHNTILANSPTTSWT
jgi:hypothetical protein